MAVPSNTWQFDPARTGMVGGRENMSPRIHIGSGGMDEKSQMVQQAFLTRDKGLLRRALRMKSALNSGVPKVRGKSRGAVQTTGRVPKV